MKRERRVMWRAAVLGAATGMRTALPITTVLRRADPALLPRPFRFRILRSSAALGAVGELVADKLPATPDRTDPAPWVGRIVVGAAAGGLVARAFGRTGPPIGSIIAGALAAGVATKVAHDLRVQAAQSAPPALVAVGEDLLASALAVTATKALHGSRSQAS